MLLFSCEKDEVLSDVPSIEFKSIAPATAQEYIDDIIISISYSDANGDLGENSSGISEYFCDNFELYNDSDLVSVSSSFWEKYEVNSLYSDAYVIELFGNQSLYIGPTIIGETPYYPNVIFPFTNGTTYKTGVLEFSCNLYIDALSSANFSFLSGGDGERTIDCRMDSNMVWLNNPYTDTTYLSATYMENQWFSLKLVCDISNNRWELFINNISIGSFFNPVNRISSVNFKTESSDDFYIDDVCCKYKKDKHNLFVKDSRNDIEYKFRIPQLAPNNNSIAIEGNFNITINGSGITDSTASQKVNYAIYVKDRAGNKSNTITTSSITIQQ